MRLLAGGRFEKCASDRFQLLRIHPAKNGGHTFATLMLEGGCDIYSLLRMMGHEEITITTIYLSASACHLQSQIAKHPLEGGGW